MANDMAQEVTNFARFYALFNKLPYQGDREEFKKQIVLQYTWNRTDSLKEMTAKEYEVCRKFRGAEYIIKVKNPKGVNKGVRSLLLDGQRMEGNTVPFSEGRHTVEVVMG